MPHLTQEQIESANRVDLAGFLLSHGERLKSMGSQKLWEKHQVWVDGYRWYSHYDSKGGYAVSFVMRYFDMDFQSAVRELIGEQYTVNDTEPKGYPKKEKQGLEVPPKNATMQRVYAYLMQQRFIARDIISYFARQNLLYEDAQYHNCIFVGLDDNGIPKHFHRRSTVGKFKQTITGSEAEYSFHYDGESEWLFVFEAPIDMLAFLTIHQNDWQKHSYVALCSVSERALLHRLEANTNLKKIVLCLDHDNAGIAASVRLKNTLTEHGYTDIRIKQPVNKDWDEDVRAGHGIEPIPAEADMSERVREICHEVVMDAALTKIPTMLRERTFSLFDKMCKDSRHPTPEQFEELTRLLLMNAKEECRKCLEPKEWSDIEKALSDSYVSYADNGNEDSRFRQLMTDMSRLRKLYEEPALINDSERFLEPILKAAMDCVRYINYENGKEQNLWDHQSGPSFSSL